MNSVHENVVTNQNAHTFVQISSNFPQGLSPEEQSWAITASSFSNSLLVAPAPTSCRWVSCLNRNVPLLVNSALKFVPFLPLLETIWKHFVWNLEIFFYKTPSHDFKHIRVDMWMINKNTSVNICTSTGTLANGCIFSSDLSDLCERNFRRHETATAASYQLFQNGTRHHAERAADRITVFYCSLKRTTWGGSTNLKFMKREQDHHDSHDPLIGSMGGDYIYLPT